MNKPLQSNQVKWLRVLGKGMVGLSKRWREEMGIENGDIVKARKEGNRVVIEVQLRTKSSVPYRVFTDAEIDEFLKEDRLPRNVVQKTRNKLSITSRL